MSSILQAESLQEDLNPVQYHLNICQQQYSTKILLVPQVGEVDKGNKGSGDDDHPWLEAACHKLLDASTTSSTTSSRSSKRGQKEFVRPEKVYGLPQKVREFLRMGRLQMKILP